MLKAKAAALTAGAHGGSGQAELLPSAGAHRGSEQAELPQQHCEDGSAGG